MHRPERGADHAFEVDLHAALSERANGNRETTNALTRAGRKGLSAAGQLARERDGLRIQRVADNLEATLAGAGFPARVVRRPGKPDSAAWPNDDVLVLVEVPTIRHWQENLETLLDICRPALRDRIGFEQSEYPSEEVFTWPDLPLPLLDERLEETVRDALGGLIEASGILASLRRDELHNEETVALEQAVTRTRAAIDEIAGLADQRDDELLAEVYDMLVEFGRRFDDEADALTRGEHVDRSLAASQIGALNGVHDEVFLAQAGITVASIEWDVSPADALERLEQASQEFGEE
jgi:hypothetical protein